MAVKEVVLHRRQFGDTRQAVLNRKVSVCKKRTIARVIVTADQSLGYTLYIGTAMCVDASKHTILVL